jgi:hypothetical protein
MTPTVWLGPVADRRAAIKSAPGPGGMIETVPEDPIYEFDNARVDAVRWRDIG